MPRDRDDDDTDDHTPAYGTRRRSRFDDEDDAPPKRKSGSFPLWAMLLIGFVAVGICISAAALVVVMLEDRHPMPNGTAHGHDVPAKRTYTRDEFKKLVMGKTEQEVVAAVGKPTSVAVSEKTRSAEWTYSGQTRDVATGKVDSSTIVEFSGGVADNIGFPIPAPAPGTFPVSSH